MASFSNVRKSCKCRKYNESALSKSKNSIISANWSGDAVAIRSISVKLAVELGCGGVGKQEGGDCEGGQAEIGFFGEVWESSLSDDCRSWGEENGTCGCHLFCCF